MTKNPSDPTPRRKTAGTASVRLRLCLSENRRFLVHEDGSPFFYLGDTAWELFHRLDREESIRYLENRAGLGFTVIQAVVLAELDGLNEPNAYGHRPLHANNPEKPDASFFEHVDFIVRQAASLGLWTGMLPTWGDKWSGRGKGPAKVAQNRSNARCPAG